MNQRASSSRGPRPEIVRFVCAKVVGVEITREQREGDVEIMGSHFLPKNGLLARYDLSERVLTREHCKNHSTQALLYVLSTPKKQDSKGVLFGRIIISGCFLRVPLATRLYFRKPNDSYYRRCCFSVEWPDDRYHRRCCCCFSEHIVISG